MNLTELHLTYEEAVDKGQELADESDLSWESNEEALALAMYMLSQAEVKTAVQIKVWQLLNS